MIQRVSGKLGGKPLNKQIVTGCHKHCAAFLEKRITFNPEFSRLPVPEDATPENFDFILLFAARCSTNKNTLPTALPNVIFCFEADLERLYGPTLKGFVNTLLLDTDISIRASP